MLMNSWTVRNMCLFSGSRRSKLPYSIGLVAREGKYCSCADVKVVRTMKEVMLGRFSRITTRTFWVGVSIMAVD